MKSFISKFIGLILSLICVLSCQLKTKNPAPIATFSISDDIHSPARFTGSYFDKLTQVEEIYFADTKSKKKLYFFNAEGKRQDSINLKALSQEIPDIDGLVILSKDTIFGFSKSSNIIAAINRTGNIIKSLQLNQIYPNNDQIKYEFSYSNLANQNLDPNNMLIGCSWLADTLHPKIKDGFKHLSYFYEQEYAAPRILQIKDFFKAEPKLSFKLNNFYAHLTDKAHAFIESPSFKQIDKNRIIYYSVYSNKLFILDKNLEIINEVVLHSEFTNIGLKPVELNQKSLSQIQEKTNYNYHNRGFLRNIFHDPQQKKYIVLILNENLVEAKTHQDPTRSFTLMVLDENFHKLKEVLFDGKSYEGANSFLTQEGLFIKKISQNLIDYEKTYALFNMD